MGEVDTATARAEQAAKILICPTVLWHHAGGEYGEDMLTHLIRDTTGLRLAVRGEGQPNAFWRAGLFFVVLVAAANVCMHGCVT